MTALLLRRSLSLKEMRAQLVLQRIPSILQSKRSCEKRFPALSMAVSFQDAMASTCPHFVEVLRVRHSRIGNEFGAVYYLRSSNDTVVRVGESTSRSTHNLQYTADVPFIKKYSVLFELGEQFEWKKVGDFEDWLSSIVNARPRGGDWNTSGTCHPETMPDLASLPVLSQMSVHLYIVLEVLSKCLNKSKAKKLDLLNVTYLTSLRKDGHSSLYYLGLGIGPPPIDRQDCSLWCLPAVPDSWKELLYAFFLEGEYS